METIKLKTYIGADGVLKLELPVGVVNQDIEILIVMQAATSEAVDAMGYPFGYFEETYGSFADTPLVRPSQLPIDSREELE